MAYGQKVNGQNSKSYLCKHTAKEVKRSVYIMTNIPDIEDPSRYLGINIFMDEKEKNNYKNILDKINVKLSAWKAKVLSLAGHVTLVKFVLSYVPTLCY